MATTSIDADKCTRTVLICDDDYLVRTVARPVFEDRGFRVLEAASGEEALAILASEPITALIVDVVLPGISGIEVCRKVRNSEAGRRLPIIVISGHAESGFINDVHTAGADLFQKKPVAWVMAPRAVEALIIAEANASIGLESANVSPQAHVDLYLAVLKPIKDAGELLEAVGRAGDAVDCVPMVLCKTAMRALKEAEDTLASCIDLPNELVSYDAMKPAILTLVD